MRGNPKEKVNEDLNINLYREAVDFRNLLYNDQKIRGHKKFFW